MKPSAMVSRIRDSGVGRDFLFRTYCKLFERFRPPVVATTFYGARLKCDPRDLIQRAIALFGVWEPCASATFARIVRPGDVVVDIGANIGYFSLLGANLVGAGGQVVAVEASPSIFRLLEANVARNGAGNVRLVHGAASDRAGELRIYKAHRSNIGRTTTDAKSGLPLESVVPAIPFNDIITPVERDRVSLIKIDVEGGELPIVRALLHAIDSYPDRLSILVEVNAESDPAEWRSTFEHLIASGFAAYDIPNSYDLSSYLEWTAGSPLRRLRALPTEQVDVLFSRSEGG